MAEEINKILDKLIDDFKWTLDKLLYYIDEDFAQDRESALQIYDEYFGG